jgi:hypothetical protein
MVYNMMDLRIGWLLLCDWWKETFYLLPSQLDEKPGQQTEEKHESNS